MSIVSYLKKVNVYFFSRHWEEMLDIFLERDAPDAMNGVRTGYVPS